MVDALTPNLGLTKPDVGGSDDTWGEKLNINFDILDENVVPVGTLNSLFAGKVSKTGDSMSGLLSLTWGGGSGPGLSMARTMDGAASGVVPGASFTTIEEGVGGVDVTVVTEQTPPGDSDGFSPEGWGNVSTVYGVGIGCGANSRGTRFGVLGAYFFNAPSSPGNPSPFYVGEFGYVGITSHDHGTALAKKGVGMGGGTLIWVSPDAANWQAAGGHQVAPYANADLAVKFGYMVGTLGNGFDTHNGLQYSAAFTINNDGDAVGWPYGFLADKGTFTNGKSLTETGTWGGTLGTMTIKDGLAFSPNTTLTGSVLKSNNINVTGDGRYAWGSALDGTGPALKRFLTAIHIRLDDDSAFSNIAASDYVIVNPLGGSLVLDAANVAGSHNLVFPAGSTDFGVTGGAGHVVKQSGVGAPFTTGPVGISEIGGLGGGIAAFLATPTSANFAAALADELGSGFVPLCTQGDWTPGITTDGTPGTPGYVLRTGSFEVVGRRCTVQFSIQFDGTWTGSPSGNVFIDGLPFPAINITHLTGKCYISAYSVAGLPASSAGIVGTIAPGDSKIILVANGPSSTLVLNPSQIGPNLFISGFATYRVA